METIIIFFAGVGMAVAGIFLGVIFILIADYFLEKWLKEYREWKFERKINRR